MLAAAQVAGAETYTWTGGGDNVSFTDMQNWGQAEGTAFDTTGSYTFGSAAPSTVNVDSAVTASGTITFASGCPQMTVTGEKISGVAKFVNSSSYAQTFNNEVSFSGAVSLSQTNPIWFIGGATGTMSASTFYGNFTITTSGNWTAGSAFTIKNGSTVTASSMTFYNHNGYLTIEKGGKFIVGGGKMDNTAEKHFTQTINGEFVIDGTFNKTKSGGTTYIEKSSGTGVFLIKGVTVASDGVLVAAYNQSDSSFDAGGARMIIGPNGILRGAGYVRAANAATHTFGAYADWNMRYQDNSYSTDYKAIYKSGNSGMTTLKFHTTDYYDKTVGRTITSIAQIGGADATCASNLCVVVSGIGKFVFANTNTDPSNLFAGGLTVQESATVEVKEGSCPGKGAVTLQSGATLLLPGTKNVAVSGALTLADNATLAITNLAAATIPVTATSIAFSGTGAANVHIRGTSALADGIYRLAVATGGGISAAKAANMTVTADAAVQGSKTLRLFASDDGKCIALAVGDIHVWTGGDGSFSESAHWLDGNVPTAGSTDPICIQDAGANVYATNDIAGLTPQTIYFLGDELSCIEGDNAFTGVGSLVSWWCVDNDQCEWIKSSVAFADTATVGGNMWVQCSDATCAGIAVAGDASSYAARGVRGNWTVTDAWTVPSDGFEISCGTLTIAPGNLLSGERLTVRYDAVLRVTGDWTFSNTSQQSIVKKTEARGTSCGKVVVDGKLVGTGSANLFPDATDGGMSLFFATGLVSSVSADWTMRLSRNAAQTNHWAVGADGISGTGGFWIYRAAGAPTHFYAEADYEINDWIGGGGVLGTYIHTCNYAGDTTHTVTAKTGGFFVSASEAGATAHNVYILGGGTYLCESDLGSATKTSSYGQTWPRLYTVQDSGTTLALAPNSDIGSSSDIKIESGAYLGVLSSGVAAAPGAVTLEDGAGLKFKLSGNAQTTLSFASAPTVNGAITVEFTQDSAPAVGVSYTLTSGAGLTDTSAFTLADGVRGTLSVENGELVYTAPEYFYITVR